MGAQNMVICENCICEVHFMYGKHHHLTHGPILLRPYIDITFFMTVAKCNKPFAMPGPKWQVTSFMQQQTWDVHQCLHVSIGNEKRAGKMECEGDGEDDISRLGRGSTGGSSIQQSPFLILFLQSKSMQTCASKIAGTFQIFSVRCYLLVARLLLAL